MSSIAVAIANIYIYNFTSIFFALILSHKAKISLYCTLNHPSPAKLDYSPLNRGEKGENKPETKLISSCR